MARGAELWRDTAPAWKERGSFLLLNPRLPATWRERVLAADFPDLPEHVWLATSGTGGVLKLVALGRQALESSARAVNAHLESSSRDVWLNPLPLFHAGGLGIVIRAAVSGARWEPCGAWSAENFLRRAEQCAATLASLVPAQVHDLAQSGLVSPKLLRAVVVGGGALHEELREAMAERGWNLLPSYGLTEAGSQVATTPLGSKNAPWQPLLPHLQARLSADGVLELRGASLLDGWMVFGEDGRARWEDPKQDDWYRTGDRAELRGRDLRVLGRTDDLVKIRGELVDVSALERELQARVSRGLIRIDVERDERNGARLIVVAGSNEAEAEARGVTGVFPPYASPSEFRVGRIELNPLGKKIRNKFS